jgi:hypothetical protein
MCARLDVTGLLADLVYAHFHGDADVEAGREQCRLYRRADGGYWGTATLDLVSPLPRKRYVEVRAGEDWRIESLLVRLPSDAQHMRDASYHVEGGVWRGTIQTDEATVEREVPFGPEMLVEVDSVWLDTLAVNYLKLASGQSRNVDVIQLDPPLLEPVPGGLRYECVGPEYITTPAGKWDAVHHVISGTRHLWTDARGIVLATRRMVEGEEHRLYPIEYHWLGED